MSTDGMRCDNASPNLMTNTSSQSGWTLSNMATVSTTDTAPDGSATARKIADNTTNGAHAFFGTGFVLANTLYTASIHVKAYNQRFISFRGEAVLSGSFPWLTLDTQTGLIDINSNLSSSTAGVIPLLSGWWRLWMQFTFFSAGSGHNILVAGSDISTAPIPTSANGNVYIGPSPGNTMSVWGGQVEPGNVLSPYWGNGATIGGNTPTKTLRGGRYALAATASAFNTGSVQVQKALNDGSFQNVGTALTGAGMNTVDLDPGQYALNISQATGVYASLTGVPTRIR